MVKVHERGCVRVAFSLEINDSHALSCLLHSDLTANTGCIFVAEPTIESRKAIVGLHDMWLGIRCEVHNIRELRMIGIALCFVWEWRESGVGRSV